GHAQKGPAQVQRLLLRLSENIPSVLEGLVLTTPRLTAAAARAVWLGVGGINKLFSVLVVALLMVGYEEVLA
ncbi:MAG: hypothetical protein VB980_00125, partial [Opitutales bacterium]